jgi:alkanesulfonate monooxygenase SsuD/methylene tetrahydromethanopterin reductase-like flavin-dependent oxidoreductase (luciferase family)
MAGTAPTRCCFSRPLLNAHAARLVTGAVLPIFNHPLKLAGEIGMLDAISGGRLDVGFARAFLPHEFRRFGRSPDESVARYRRDSRGIQGPKVRRLFAGRRGVRTLGPSPRCHSRKEPGGAQKGPKTFGGDRRFESSSASGESDPNRGRAYTAVSGIQVPGLIWALSKW